MSNFETALAGMRRGEKWKRPCLYNHCYWWIDGKKFKNQDGESVRIDNRLVFATDWERYEESKRSLSFDEAVKCKQVMITAPDGYFNGNSRTRHMIKMSGWTPAEISLLDLAERRGWRMEEAE